MEIGRLRRAHSSPLSGHRKSSPTGLGNPLFLRSEYFQHITARIFHRLINWTRHPGGSHRPPHVAAVKPQQERQPPVGWRSDGSNQPFSLPQPRPWSHGPHEHIRRSFAGPFGPFTFGLATLGAFIVSVVGPLYLITLLPLRLTMSSYLFTMPLVLVMRPAFADQECRPYLCQVDCTTTDVPHTCIRPTARVGSATSANQLSVGTMMWRSGQHLSYHSPPPGKTFSRCSIRMLEMMSCAQLLACGGVGLVPSGGSGTGWTERSFGNLNGVGADPTKRGGSGT
ncbi:hypothetical protein B296_00041517 [Ensete ventricosum]|uniref:Uncharacterized protein n=1 Tax=Ensete ventricosum TaxID=4639 RepID=A0A426X0M6_ENSVE|nr:hypothetical protein B296_00041517 [Ensete ventricosum]